MPGGQNNSDEILWARAMQHRQGVVWTLVRTALRLSSHKNILETEHEKSLETEHEKSLETEHEKSLETELRTNSLQTEHRNENSLEAELSEEVLETEPRKAEEAPHSSRWRAKNPYPT